MSCPGSASLLQVKNYSPAGTQGTKTHAKYLKPGGLPRNCREWLCGNDPRNAPVSSSDRFEASFEYDPASGQARYLGSNLDRAYDLSAPNLTSGTLDVYNWWIDDWGAHVRIADLKTGFLQVSGDLPEPEDAWQLRWAACAVLSHLTRPELLPALDLRLAWFLPDELGIIQIHDAPVTLDQLETFRQGLVQLSERLINQAGAAFRTGPWCGRCPGLTRCPVQLGIVERIGVALDGPITERTIVDLWRASKTLEPLLDQAKQLIQQYLEHNGLLETRPGYALGATPQRRKTLSPDAVAISRAILNKVPIKEQLDLDALAEQLGPDEYKQAIVALVSAGALRSTTSVVVRESRRKIAGH